ncbi:MAG: PQQ-binding-like beta-propeller repeat protein [Candidatus Rokubacteria bacterium]|nr:PQQ-binding-like beta-propeller repeat protein [Candidatus Rokubacteria bacterium]
MFAASAGAGESPPVILWDSLFDGPATNDDSEAVAVGPDGGVVATGFSCPAPTEFNCFSRTIKYDGATGVILWNVVFSSGVDRDDTTWGVAIGSDGHPVIAGDSCNLAFTACDTRVMKLDGTTGAILWNVTVPSGPNASTGGVAIVAGGHAVVSRSGCDANLSHCAWRVTKLDGATGAVLWNTSFDSRDDDIPERVAAGPDGDPVVVGSSCRGDACIPRVIKQDGASGRMLWETKLPKVLRHGQKKGKVTQGAGVGIGPDGDPVVSVWDFAPQDGSSLVRAVKLDGRHGHQRWNVVLTRSDALPRVVFPRDVGVDSKNNPIVQTQSCIGIDCDWILHLLDGDTGASIWTVTLSPPGNHDQATGLAVGSDDNPVITGADCPTSFDECRFRTVKYQRQPSP